jgi:hypothetical protein
MDTECRELLKVVYSVLTLLVESEIEDKISLHAGVVAEMIRLFQANEAWCKVLAKNKQLAKAFQLDSLILNDDEEAINVGVSMGAMILVKVANLEPEDIVSEDLSKEKIHRGMIRYVAGIHGNMKSYFADAVTTIHDRCSQLESICEHQLQTYITKLNELTRQSAIKLHVPKPIKIESL